MKPYQLHGGHIYLGYTNSAEECSVIVKKKHPEANAMYWTISQKDCKAFTDATGFLGRAHECDDCLGCMFSGILFHNTNLPLLSLDKNQCTLNCELIVLLYHKFRSMERLVFLWEF